MTLSTCGIGWHSREGEHKEAFKLFSEMLNVKTDIDTVTFNTVILGLCVFGFVQDALNLSRKDDN